MPEPTSGYRQRKQIAFGCRVSPEVRDKIRELAVFFADREKTSITSGEVVMRAIDMLHSQIMEQRV